MLPRVHRLVAHRVMSASRPVPHREVAPVVTSTCLLATAPRGQVAPFHSLRVTQVNLALEVQSQLQVEVAQAAPAVTSVFAQPMEEHSVVPAVLCS